MLHCLVSLYRMWDSLWLKIQTLFLNPNTAPNYPGVIGCNLIHLGCEEFGIVYEFKAFEEFHCPSNIYLVFFSQMCSLYHQGKLSESPQTHSASQIPSGSININTSRINAEVKETNPGQESVLGQVWVGNTCQAICIPANSVKVMQGRLTRSPGSFHVWLRLEFAINFPGG